MRIVLLALALMVNSFCSVQAQERIETSAFIVTDDSVEKSDNESISEEFLLPSVQSVETGDDLKDPEVNDSNSPPSIFEINLLQDWLEEAVHLNSQNNQSFSVVASAVQAQKFFYANIQSKATDEVHYRKTFPLHQLTATLTNSAVLQLIERGDLKLDDTVSSLIDFEVPEVPDTVVKVRHLVEHTSGWVGPFENLYSKTPENTPSLRHWLKTNKPLARYLPGTKQAYSVYNTALLGLIIERVTNAPFHSAFASLVTEPVSMFNTSLPPLASTRIQKSAVKMKTIADTEFPTGTLIPIPAGGLYSTSEDMARFMSEFLPSGHTDNVRMLSPKTLKNLFESKVDAVDSQLPQAMLFSRTNKNNIEQFSVTSSQPHVASLMVLIPGKDIGLFISVLGLQGPSQGNKILQTLESSFFDFYFPADITPKIQRDSKLQLKARTEQLAGSFIPSNYIDGSWLSFIGLVNQLKIKPQPDHSLLITEPMLGRDNPTKWVEIIPNLWMDLDSQRYLNVHSSQLRPQLIFNHTAEHSSWKKAQWFKTADFVFLLLLIAAICLSFQAITLLGKAVLNIIFNTNLGGSLCASFTQSLALVSIWSMISWLYTTSLYIQVDSYSLWLLASQWSVLATFAGVLSSLLQILICLREQKSLLKLLFCILTLFSFSTLSFYAVIFNLTP